MDFFEGANLDALSLKGEIGSRDAVRYGQRVGASLNRTLRSSTSALAAREIAELFARICRSPMFSGIDQKFLENIVFPFVQAGSLRGLPKSRWTNGDFLPRNILVDAKDNVRLVDYEFANRTHFFGEDWWRWRTFSSFQSESRDIPALREGTDTGPWLEAYFILRQMVLVHDVSGAQLAVAEATPLIDRLVTLTAEAHSGFRTSLLFNKLATGRGDPSLEIKDRTKGSAQLYWSASENYGEQDSQRLSYEIGRDEVVRFNFAALPGKLNLRFDPADSVGLVEIRAIRVSAKDKTLLALSETVDWSKLRLGSGFIRLTNTPSLKLLSLNGDPSLLLPEIDVDVGTAAATCEIWLKFAADLDNLPDLMRSQAAALAELGSADDNQAFLPEPAKILLLTPEQIPEIKERETALNAEVSNLRRELDGLSAEYASWKMQAGEEQSAAVRELSDIREKLERTLAQLASANESATQEALQSRAALDLKCRENATELAFLTAQLADQRVQSEHLLATATEQMDEVVRNRDAEQHNLKEESAQKDSRLLELQDRHERTLDLLATIKAQLADSERLRCEAAQQAEAQLADSERLRLLLLQRADENAHADNRFGLALATREAEVALLRNEILYLKQADTQLRASGSWRITEPLRFLRTLLEKLFQSSVKLDK